MTIKINWGTGIALTYGLFALATTGFVVFAMEQPVSLVSPTYYEDSLREDARIAAARNASALAPDTLVIDERFREVRIALPPDQAGASGTVTFYRASDPGSDRTVRLALDATGRQTLPLDTLRGGAWVVQMRWTAHDRAFYLERPLFVR